jgi:CRP-like cAMP-binding protein
MKEVIAFLGAVSPLTDSLQVALHNAARKIEVRRLRFVHSRPDVCTNLYFIEKGLLCCYDRDKDTDRQYCTWAMAEGNIVTCVSSFDSGLPSTESILAVEDSVLWTIDRSQLEALTRSYPEFQYIRLRLTEHYHVESRNMDAWRKRPPEQFLARLEAEYPSLITRLPNKHLASLMGIRESTLYGIKRTIYEIRRNKRKK